MAQGYEIKVSSFDDALNEHKRLLTESLVNFDEGQRVRKIMLDIDSNSSDYEYYFQSGQQSKQVEVDELKKKYDAMYNAFVVADDCRKEWHRCYVGIRQSEDKLHERVKELELINFDSELHFDAAKEHIDHLQKRIDDALMWCEKGCVLKAIEILKGGETK